MLLSLLSFAVKCVAGIYLIVMLRRGHRLTTADGYFIAVLLLLWGALDVLGALVG